MNNKMHCIVLKHGLMGNVTEGSLMRIKNAIFLNKIVEEIIDYDKKKL